MSDVSNSTSRFSKPRFATFALLALTILCSLSLAWAQEHPVPLEKNFNLAQCVSCHEDKTQGKAVHSAIAMGCTACHEVKSEKEVTTVTLTAPSARALCVTCHAEKDASGTKGAVHPPVAKDCITCHSPHSSANKNQLLKATSGEKADNLCLTCHDKGVKVPEKGSRHAALDMGCETCHVTHKTGEPGKKEFDFHLSKALPALCVDCHEVKDKALTAAHRGQPFAQADCTSCHDAHQSPFPKLMNAHLHPPFAEKACDTCHQAPQDGKVVVNEDGKRALCYMCHDAVQKQVEQSKAQHPVFAVTDTCTGCHNPHASRSPKLLQSAQRQVCASCHEESKEPVRHGPYDQGQCADCHDPHGTELPKLLRADGNNLCRGCHVLGQSGVKAEGKIVTLPWRQELSATDYAAAPKLGLDRGGERGHPLIGHPISGKNTKLSGEITCRSCHQPHSSKINNLMPSTVNDDTQLCEQCHK